jgi:hypothetical protein
MTPSASIASATRTKLAMFAPRALKANHAKMQFGAAGVGSGTHLPCELLNLAIGVTVTTVPFRGTGQVMQALITGRIDYFCETITGAARVKAGTVKGLAVMAPERASSHHGSPLELDHVEAALLVGDEEKPTITCYCDSALQSLTSAPARNQPASI